MHVLGFYSVYKTQSHMATVTQDPKNQSVMDNLSSNWRTSGDSYVSTDDIINAYKAGRADGSRSEFLGTLQGSIGEGINKATKLGETFYTQLREVFGVDCKKVMLKVDGVLDNGSKPTVHFELLYIVAEKDYVQDSFLGIYDLSSAFCDEANDESFNTSISFMTYDENINEELLNCDGFKYAYE